MKDGIRIKPHSNFIEAVSLYHTVIDDGETLALIQRVPGNGMTKACSYYLWSQQGGQTVERSLILHLARQDCFIIIRAGEGKTIQPVDLLLVEMTSTRVSARCIKFLLTFLGLTK